MTVTAIFNRNKIDPKCRSILVLDSEGYFWEVRPEDKFTGVDVAGNRLYTDTGNIETGEAFKNRKPYYPWTFEKALRFAVHFGWQLEKNLNNGGPNLSRTELRE